MSVNTLLAAISSVVTSSSGSPTCASVVGDAAPTTHLRPTKRRRKGIAPSRLAIGAFFAVLLAPIGTASACEGCLTFDTTASPAQEVQDPMSDGWAHGTFWFTPSLSVLNARVSVQGLTSAVAAAHLHCAKAGADGPVVVSLDPITGVTDGSIVDGDFTNAEVIAGCVAECGFEVNNIASLRFAAQEGCVYLNVHTDTFAPGEVRGQLLER